MYSYGFKEQELSRADEKSRVTLAPSTEMIDYDYCKAGTIFARCEYCTILYVVMGTCSPPLYFIIPRHVMKTSGICRGMI